MSSSGEFPGFASTTPTTQMYFCHQCNRPVSITPSPSPTADLACPTCHGGFLEELENPNSDFFDAGLPLFRGAVHSNNPFVDISALLGGIVHPRTTPTTTTTTTAPRFQDPDPFNPFLFLQNYLQTIRDSGANVQFVIDSSSSGEGSIGAGLRLPSNIGDYFVGPGLEQLIQQLAENDPNRYGTPPASKNAVKTLPSINISKEMLDSDSSQCAVCMDTFELDEKAKQMPCKHIYHDKCILPWLELHNSCPVCRHELPTDDTEYELRARGDRTQNIESSDSAALDGGDGSDQSRENPDTSNTMERRFRVSLPWPFRFAFGSSSESSNSGTGNNDGNSNSSNRGSGT